MCVRYLGFLLLVWFPGALYAQSARQHCSPPSLEEGYFVPEGDTYFHEATLPYACNEGFKPAVEEGWWATSTCQNGLWSPTPRCIGKGDCIPPEIPNAKKQSQNYWYEDGHTLTITCDKGYEPKGQVDTAGCTNGTWSPVLVCESIQACGEPPKIPHAVVIHKRYQEEFVVNTKVEYDCEAGYAVEGADSTKFIVCKAGNWTDGPTCSRATGPGPGQGGAAGGGHTSANSGTQLGGGGRGTRPGTGQGGAAGTGQGGSVEEGTAGGHTTSTVGSGRQPGGRGSSTTFGSNDKPMFMPVEHCGVRPVVENGVVLEVERMSLKYQCKAYYTIVGSDTVTCYNDGTWSEIPTCKEAFCRLDLAQYPLYGFQQSGAQFLEEGETKWFPCIWDYFNRGFQCRIGKITFTQCCQHYDIQQGRCRFRAAQ